MNCDDMRSNSSKIISRIISLTFLLFADSNITGLHRLLSFDRYISRMKFPTGLIYIAYRNLHSFARFPGVSTILVHSWLTARDAVKFFFRETTH